MRIIHLPFIYRLALILILLRFLPSIQAQTWVGGAVGQAQEWNQAANWNPATIPSTADHVIIPNTTYSPILSSDGGTIASLTIQAGATLTLDNASILKVTNALQKGIAIQAGGNLFIDAGASLHISGMTGHAAIHVLGEFFNYGEIKIENVGMPLHIEGAAADFRNFSYILAIGYTKMLWQNNASIKNAITGEITGMNATFAGIEMVNVQPLNEGRITLTSAGEGILATNGSIFTHAGILDIRGIGASSGDDGIELTTASLINDGEIYVRDTWSGILVNSGGVVANNKMIEIAAMRTSMELLAGGNVTNSSACGYILLVIGIRNAGTFLNDAYLSGGLGFINSGTFTNDANGVICDLNNVYGAGVTANNGAIHIANCPAAPSCPVSLAPPTAIPTMSEWALILLAFCLACAGLLQMGSTQISGSHGSTYLTLPHSQALPIHKLHLTRASFIVLLLALLGVFLSFLLTGSLTFTDFIGGIFASVPLTYGIHLWFWLAKTSN